MGRGKGTETEISTTGWQFNTYAYWMKPQQKSINVGSESLWRENKWSWGEGALLRSAWMLHLTPFSCALKISSNSLFLSFFLDINLKTVIKSFPEFHCLFPWVSEHWSGVMDVSSFSHLVWSMIAREHMAGIWNQGILDTSTCGIGLDFTDTVSEASGRWVPHWLLGIWCLVWKPCI